MRVAEIVKERKYRNSYIVRDEKWLTNFEDELKGHTQLMKDQAYNLKGEWICDSKWAHELIVQRGIMPEKANPSYSVCSIGFCKKEQKWYGWSHRAMYGFGIGSTCKKGDCHYQPANKKDFIQDCIRFWDDRYRLKTKGIEAKNNGVLGVQVSWTHSPKIKNKKLRLVFNK